MRTTNSEGVNLRQGIGMQLGAGINISQNPETFPLTTAELHLPSTQTFRQEQNALLSNPDHMNLSKATFSTSSPTSTVFSNKTRGIFESDITTANIASISKFDISPNFSISTSNGISDSSSIQKDSNQNETASIHELSAYQESQNLNKLKAFSDTNSNTENFNKQTSTNVSENTYNSKNEVSNQSIGTVRNQSNTFTKSIGYDETANILSEATKQFESIQSALRTATINGGKHFSTNLKTDAQDEHRNNTTLEKTKFPSNTKINDIEEKMQQEESRILLQYAPVYVHKKKLTTPINDISSIENKLTHLQKRHKKIKEAAQDYRTNESGVKTVIDNAFLGGMHYKDPFNRLSSND